ncbi:PAS domain S-box protein [Rubrolithibacter danxiaensis]|uniref:PAS domain S-box protein n=1 Tax=Rubrolithibacter danxiaensis TaxID=3390805 RepID=UPI003BF8E3E9
MMTNSEPSNSETFICPVLSGTAGNQFDAISRLASYICNTPEALITLLNNERKTIKYKSDLGVSETPLNLSFCQYTLQNGLLFEIEDSWKDERVSSFPITKGDKAIRYYAGVPLINPHGERVGALCVIDYQPNRLNKQQKEALQILACQVVSHLEMERKNAELQDLLTKAQKFHGLFNNSNEIHCITDSEGHIEFVNDSIYELLGFTSEEIIGKNIWEFSVAGERERLMPAIYEAISKGEDRFAIETRILKKDGTLRWFEWADVIKEGYWLVNGRDITARKEAEMQLQTLSMAIEKSAAGILTRNANNEISWMNTACEKILGYQLEELKGKQFGNLLIGEETDKKVLAYANQAIAERKSYEVEIKLYNKSRNPVWLFISTNPLFNSQGELESQISVVFDISERKRAEEQLIKTREDAIQLSKAKEGFLSVMSHEMRTPLNAVICVTRLLKEENPLERQKEHLNILDFSAQNLLTLINDVLDFTKIETGNLQLEAVPVNISDLVSKTIESLKFRTGEKDLRLSYHIDPKIPSYITGDSIRLYQIFMNLLGNAVKFTNEGEVLLSLQLVKEERDRVSILFKVSDTGIGIAANKLQLIFDAYTQADSDTSRKYGGTGLGLAITKKLIELYHSQINVESELGKGTTFSFTISFKKVGEAESVLNPVEELEEDLDAYVLVVDDNSINRLLAGKVLKKWNVQADFAENGREAIEKIRENRYDIVLMDIHMPEMDGDEAVKIIRELPEERFKELPVIALTGSAIKEDQDKFLKMGMNDFVLKPFDTKILYKKLKYFTRMKPELNV